MFHTQRELPVHPYQVQQVGVGDGGAGAVDALPTRSPPKRQKFVEVTESARARRRRSTSAKNFHKAPRGRVGGARRLRFKSEDGGDEEQADDENEEDE